MDLRIASSADYLICYVAPDEAVAETEDLAAVLK
jgi:hypothetical protein